MKNNNNQQITQARIQRVEKLARTDILVIPEVVQENMRRIAAQPPRRKRRINYEKKILNDAFLFSA